MKNLADLANDLDKRQKAIALLEKTFPPAIGVICVREIKGNFKKNQATWKKRSKVTDTLYEYNRTNAYRTPKLGKKSKHVNPYKGSAVHANRPILVQTTNLRESIIYKAVGNNVLIGVLTRTVNVGGKSHDALSYAKIHNEGGSFTMFGKHSATMPKRQFMPKPSQGPTKTMWDAINKKYTMELNKIMQGWQV